ncbi:UNVERIFIED_CONTAM: Retrovirus-related Pol polyprotein from transposon RE1 [Sesamum angustifolium]|uniref:Retrovirus-related Pol polyprotein from transposon RE1 n=1 Tax=Sesamum angustifolium TaxID=2727405 RepID=A0AAW2QUA3_9LAMI
MATPEILQTEQDLLMYATLFENSKDGNVKSRGMEIEKKIEFLEGLAGRVSNRRSRRWINDRLLMELVPRLNAEEIRGLFAPPPWGDDVPPSPFCMTNVGEWDNFRNIDMDKEASIMKSLESSSAKQRDRVDADKVAALLLGTGNASEHSLRTVGTEMFWCCMFKILSIAYYYTVFASSLTGDNYLVWSRAVRFALGAKKKLSFIDGRSVRPTDNSEELDEWIRIDCMIITWILNSVSKEIVDAFIYATSARALWLELEARYGGSNGPMIYNLEREISSISQGDMSVTTYFTKIKMLWDELICLDPLPVCTCTAHRQTADREASRQLMRFLMGLSSVYEHVRRQILLMEPRPHVQKAFAMVLQVEKELQVQVHLPDTNNGVVYQLQHRDSRKDKRAMFCEHCRKSGHLKETCFKLHGTPEWYRDLTEKKRKGAGRGRGFVAAIETIPEQSSQLQIAPKPNLADLLRTEIRKMMIEENTSPHQMRTPLDNNIRINFARLEELDEAADASIQYPTSPSFPSPLGSPTPHTVDFSPPISDPITTSPVQPSLLYPNQAPRRSTRHISKPQWLTDFICHYTNQSHITDLMPSYECFVAALSTLQEPQSYKQAIGKPEWEDAMHQELLALDKNHTWEVTTLPPGKKAIGCRWVYKLKLRDDGTVERCKARLVAKGYNQVAGVDYVDCFSPVAKAVTGHVCKLKRSLYGLKQASRQWNQEFTSQLVAFGFTQSSHDHCLFFMGSEDTFVAMLIYVDDVLITSPSVSLLTDVKSYLDGLFTIKDLGVARYFLGLQIARSPTGTSVTQTKYINDIVRDTGLMHAKSVTTPFPTSPFPSTH